MSLSHSLKQKARAKGPLTMQEITESPVFPAQHLVVVEGPFKGRICENDDDWFVPASDSSFEELSAWYEIKDQIRFIVDDDLEEEFGIPCQIVYFGSPTVLMSLGTGHYTVPDFALRPATIQDYLNRLNEIFFELVHLVGPAASPSEREWEESFLLSEERSFILNEMWQREILMSAQSGAAKNIFLCHSSADKPFVRRIAADLTAAGHKTWLDEFEIKAGDSIVEKISLGTSRADALVFFVSEASVASNWVAREWQSVMSRKLSGESVKLIPAKLANCPLPSILSDIKYADFVQSYQDGLNEIYAALRDSEER